MRILGFPHGVEHLSRAAQAVWGPGTAESTGWLGEQAHTLKHGDPDQVLEALRTLPVEGANDRAAAGRVRDETLYYLGKRRGQISYAQFLDKGYPIGSGAVESANKLVVEARLKGSGMHWARVNVNPDGGAAGDILQRPLGRGMARPVAPAPPPTRGTPPGTSPNPRVCHHPRHGPITKASTQPRLTS